MPIEISELVIKAKVNESQPPAQGNSNTSNGNHNGTALEPLERAVKEIMDILKRKNER